MKFEFNPRRLRENDFMLQHKKTKQLMRTGIGDKNEVDKWVKNFHSKESNYKTNTYYRVENTGVRYAGVGYGLYLGRDPQALSNFYDLEQDGLPISEYKGNPKWLDLSNYSDYKKFIGKFEKKGMKIENSDEIGKEVQNMGYDGIRYYDPYATGDEYVLYNLKALRKTKSNFKILNNEIDNL